MNIFIQFQALTLTSGARKESTVGEIVNLMSIDTQHIQDTINYFWAVWSSPLQIGVCLYFLYEAVGPSMFSGFGVLVLLFPINGIIMSKLHKLQGQQMIQKDNRIKLLTEVLNGIKVGLGFFYICVKIFYRQMFFHWTPSQVNQTIYTAAAVNIYHMIQMIKYVIARQF